MASAIKLSYHQRLFLTLFVYSWMIVLCFIGFQYVREKQHKSELLNLQLQTYNQSLLEVIESNQSIDDFESTRKKPFEDLRITIIDHSGVVLYDNMIAPDSLDNHSRRTEIVNTMLTGYGHYITRQSASDGREYFYSATRGKDVIVRSAIPYSETLLQQLGPDWLFAGVLIVISIAMSIFAYNTTQRLGKTIKRLDRFAQKAKKGEFFNEDEPFPNDELGSISNHIVQLYAQWQQTIKDQYLCL